jgi:hypothetical protein
LSHAHPDGRLVLSTQEDSKPMVGSKARHAIRFQRGCCLVDARHHVAVRIASMRSSAAWVPMHGRCAQPRFEGSHGLRG